MKCLKCESEHTEGAEFCMACGGALGRVCPRCHFLNPFQFRFCGDCGQELAEPLETEQPSPAFEGERKHATVLFADLSGYTAMTEKIDPEEVKEIMGRIFGEIARVVEQYEGVVERFFGDEVMALFGVPKAHEDDPVRAIKAAMEVHDLVKNMSPEFEGRVGRPLALHSGINTGLLVTGDEYIGKGRHGLTGDTINLAARLTKLAQAGDVLVGPDTYRQAEGHFTFEDLEPTTVKGKEEPVQVYRVLSAMEKPRKIHRLQGLRADLIGRKTEMAQLAGAVERLRQGESSIISIIGDAGTGKSRLVEEFKATLDPKEVQWREGHAFAYAQNIPFSPVIDMLNRAWKIEEGDPPEKVKEKVQTGIEYLIKEKEDVVPYVGSLYALKYPEMEGLDPEFWRTGLHKAVKEILSALTQKAPTIICLEDLHWADASSLDLLRFVLSDVKHPALFLLVYRPYFTLLPGGQRTGLGRSYQEILLQDLSSSEAEGMTQSLLKAKSIPTDLQRFIQERVDGNPFYLEEVINALVESEALVRDNGNWKLARSISELEISPTIHGVISSRLDRLDKEARRILQEASVIGRAFLYEILKRVTDLKEGIDHCLSILEQLDLIRTRCLQPDLEYLFKHALTQEVVYEGLLKKERQSIHERIGIVMEQLFRDRLPEFYEALAFHFKRGLSTLKAVDYLAKSGEKSLKRYAVEESHQYYKEAFELLTNKADRSKEEQGVLVDLLNSWAVVFYFRGDFRGQEALLEAHVNMAESLGDKARLGLYYAWFGSALENRGRIADSHEYLRMALKLGEEIGDDYVVGYACALLTWNWTHLGHFENAIASCDRAQEIAAFLESDQYIQYKSLGGLGFAYWARGDTQKTLETGQALLDYGRERSNLRSQSFGHWVMGFGHLARGNFDQAIESCLKAIQVTKDPYYSHLPKSTLGLSYVMIGEFQEAEMLLRETVSFSDDMGCDSVKTQAEAVLGLISIARGNMQAGFTAYMASQRELMRNDDRSVYAISQYMLGKLYLQMVEGPRPSLWIILTNAGFLIRNLPFASRNAEYHLNKAIELAQEIGAKGTLGMAYLDLGILHKAKKRRENAAECFLKAIQLFEEGEANGYLKQAKEALASLG